jgi:hypothetical protein
LISLGFSGCVSLRHGGANCPLSLRTTAALA